MSENLVDARNGCFVKTDWGKRFRQRLANADQAPKLIIGVLVRKLVHVAVGVLKSNKPFNSARHCA